jgi:hypothetical protein
MLLLIREVRVTESIAAEDSRASRCARTKFSLIRCSFYSRGLRGFREFVPVILHGTQSWPD